MWLGVSFQRALSSSALQPPVFSLSLHVTCTACQFSSSQLFLYPNLSRHLIKDLLPGPTLISLCLLYYSAVGAKRGFPGGGVVKNPPADAGDAGSIPGWGRSPGEGNGTPLQHSCLESPRDGGARWGAAVHVVAKSWTWLGTQACRLQRECIVNWTGYKNNFFIACWYFSVLIMNVLWAKIWLMVCQCKHGLIVDAMSRYWRQFVYKSKTDTH